MSQHLNAVCFGEILYDIFPNSEKIGGAPLNVASRLSANGIQTGMVSSVGQDKKGENLLKYLKSRNIDNTLVAKTSDYPTGVVNVSLDKSGSASYTIEHPAAWDKIEISEKMKETVKASNAFIFGSLACRDAQSRETLLQLLTHAKFRVFDINLRPPHYNKEIIEHLIMKADFIKFNDDELYEIAEMFDSPFHSLEQNLSYMAKITNAKSICVTKGSHGAVLFTEEKLYYNSGYKVKVADTVGSGDSFLASLISKLLKDETPQKALNYACAMGAMVASKEGANPEFSSEEIEAFMFPEVD
ncbi:carbohydrate kinase family protein [Zunongwangia sp. HGR-M22]|uniref:carbohydrate kinase family protein n=1 Tax=Zunongwangia sp. HGR-M22 TaxID=3015168 RepID=UPI0022DE86ED|nr:carbohydrate kinase [Zunongwangia sp. HGR-M22]WBL25568.1 carbohydrate kinase [Zunongwangia sp. HGR-M22]